MQLFAEITVTLSKDVPGRRGNMRSFISKLWVVCIAMIVTMATGCSNGGAEAGMVDVSIEQAFKMWQNKEAIIIDIRTPQEYKEGHIPGVANIPLDQLVERNHEIPTDKKVLLICRSGNRSSQGTSLLRSKGFGNVYNITKGMSSWQGPIE